MYSFMHLMTDFLDELARLTQKNTRVKSCDVVALLNGEDGPRCATMDHTMPVSLLQKAGLIEPWVMDSVDKDTGAPFSPFYNNCRHGVLQYVVVATFAAIMASLLELLGFYHEAKVSVYSGWLYLCLLRNLSQFVALYSLVMFYRGAKGLLKDLRPFPKFLSIKLVIFFTFWQKLVLIGLRRWDLLPVHSLYEDQYDSGLVNTTEHGVGVSTWGDDISSPELFNELASAGIQNL